jgi:DNA-binding NarL/FixJ family response regulator
MAMPLTHPRVVIAEDHNLVAELYKKLLDTEFDVVAIAKTGRELIRVAVALKPDVALVDIAMPILNGLDAGKQVKEKCPTVKLIYLTMNPDPELALEAFNVGASGYLLKTCAASELVVAVRDVLRGKTLLSQTLKEPVDYLRWERKKPTAETERLTVRQREVLQLLAEGRIMKEVADVLKMTTRTVAFHKYRIMQELGAKSSADLVRYAVRNHIVAA